MIMLLVGVGCAACAPVAGTAAPAPAPAPPTTAPGGITLPPRPRDIPIDNIDPCSLLTAEQRAALTLDGEPGNSTHFNQLLGAARDCTILGFGTPNVGLGIALAPDTGIERYTDDNLLVAITPITVEGFPALLVRYDRFSDACTVAIDIAPGQLIDLQYSDGGAQAPVPQDQLCRGAERTATEVMRTLLAR
jgi:Protein of unknown function (DUF3558).